MNRPIIPGLRGLAYGGDYNPEQWPEAVWAEDVALMREANVSLVTVGVFSWALLETRQDEWNFGWLDRLLDLLHANGVAVDLATATASPPVWLVRAHPEILPVTQDGVRLSQGARQHWCPSSEAFRTAAVKLAGKVAERYADHPAVVMWHINNEYGCHTNECFCDRCAEAFRGWLTDRYRTIDGLNQAWTTSFWSQHYNGFDEIDPPRAAPAFRNPAQRLDYRRFMSDQLLACFRAEKAAVRAIDQRLPLTTNFISLFKPVDYWRWADEVDVISNDSYPDPQDGRTEVEAALSQDLMRSLGRGRPWILMEQATGAVQWRPVNATKPAKMMQTLSLQAVARGADGICFFQWRQSRGGAEQFHSGMVPHAGTASRIWRNVKELGATLTDLADVVGTESTARVAIVLDWDSWWAVEGEAQPTEISYAENLTAWYAAVHRLNVAIDFVPADGDLSAYAVVIAPHLFVLDAGPAERMDRFVRDGGVLVGTYLTGIVDSSVQAHLGGYPGPLASTFGVRVEEFAPTAATLTLDSSLPIRMPDATQWAEYLTLDNASAVASFTHDDLQGSPAITRHEHGNGTAWYVGTRLAQEALDQLVRTVLEEAGIDLPFADLPEGIEVVVRGDRLFLLNHTGASYTLAEVTGVPPVAVDAGDCVVLTMNLSEIEALA